MANMARARRGGRRGRGEGETDVSPISIFNQPGGRGSSTARLMGRPTWARIRCPTAMDRRMFNCATNKDAIKVYTWC
ncbi:MAG: hypothetical protein ACLUZZ_06330 [Alistipes inops]